MKEDFNQKSLDFYLQNSSILIFAIGFLAIIVTNIFLKMINLNQYLHYIFLLLISSFTIVSISHTFSLLRGSFLSNKNLTLVLNALSWLAFFYLVFIIIDYDIYYKWNPEKASIYADPSSYLLAIFLIFIILKYPKLTNRASIRKAFNFFLISFAALVSIYISSFLIINDYHIYYTNAVHMDVVIYPIVQVFLGKAQMVDFNAQYGAYAHFMEPLLWITGLSLESITSIFSLLMFGSLFSIAYALFKLLDNKLLAMVGFFAFLYAIITTFMLYPYQLLYQIYPIRIIFPAYAILAAVFYFKKPSRKLFLVHIAVLSCGVLWNIDRGIIALVAFSAALLFPALSSKSLSILQKIISIIKDLAIIAIVFFSILCLYSFYIKIRFGSIPELHQMFISFGFFSSLETKFPLNKTTTFGIFIYVFAFMQVVKESFKQKTEYRNYVIFFLLMLGLGIFFRSFISFSNNGQLYSIYPAILILIIFADKWLIYLKQFNVKSMLEVKDKLILRSNYYFLIVIIGFLSYSCIFFFYHNYSPLFQNAVRINEFYPLEPDNEKLAWYAADGNVFMKDIAIDSSLESPWQERARKLKIFYDVNSLDDRTIAIFSMWDGYLHMKLNHPSPLPVINSQHVLVTQDWDRLIQILISKEIDFFFVDTSFIRDFPRSEEWEKVINILNKNYNKTKKIPLQPSWNYIENEWQKTEFTIYQKKI